jgi:hypothetical protein
MSLTLEAEQRLADAGLTGLFDKHQNEWLGLAKKTKGFVDEAFPAGSRIRRDDVAKALLPIIEVHETLKEYLSQEKLRGKIWVRFFVDLIIDRTWDTLNQNGEPA